MIKDQDYVDQEEHLLKALDFHIHPKWSTSYPRGEVEVAQTFAEQTLEFLDGQGIERAVVLPVSPFVSNDTVSEAVETSPDRPVGFASVLPNLGGYALEELEHAVKNLGLKGLKLHPPMQGFSLQDPKVWRCIRRAGELGVPVFLHCLLGDYSALAFRSEPAPWLVRAQDYALLPHVCPDTTLIYAHLGGLFGFEEIVRCASFPNVYLETSYSLPQITERYPIERYIEAIGSKKFIFGSDYVPGMTPEEHWPRPQIEAIERLEVSEEAKANILYGNACRILEIEM